MYCVMFKNKNKKVIKTKATILLWLLVPDMVSQKIKKNKIQLEDI